MEGRDGFSSTESGGKWKWLIDQTKYRGQLAVVMPVMGRLRFWSPEGESCGSEFFEARNGNGLPAPGGSTVTRAMEPLAPLGRNGPEKQAEPPRNFFVLGALYKQLELAMSSIG